MDTAIRAEEFKINKIKEQYAWTPEEIEVYKERQKKRNEKALCAV